MTRSPVAPWQTALESAVGERLVSATPLGGGDIGDAFRARLESGTTLFVKHYRRAPGGGGAPGDHEASGGSEAAGDRSAPGDLAASEAAGLAWLTAAGSSIRIARPVAWDRDWLALEWIESAAPAESFDRRLGEGLAELHAASPGSFGLAQDNWIGRLPQPNAPDAEETSSWADFYATRRIQPMRLRAASEGLLPARLERALEGLIRRMPELVGVPEEPARLHGDLWSGNVLPDERGLPCLIDPACYGGHREIDLAMMRLFGGFAAPVFAAYEACAPLSPGAGDRVALYQVYPLLVHVCLFGSSYVDRLERAVRQALWPRSTD